MHLARDPDINKLVWPKDGNKFAWIDRAKAIMDFVTRAGTMYLGYQAFEKVAPGSGLSGAIVSQIAMRLATADNLISGAAGIATLTAMGIMNIQPADTSARKDTTTWIEQLVQPFWPGYVDPLRPVELPP